MARKAWTHPKPRRESDGPWLLWSHYHGAWHRRSETGGAAGYTIDIIHAGFFDLRVARPYHDWREGRNEAFPLKAVRAKLDNELARMTAARDALAARLATLQDEEAQP